MTTRRQKGRMLDFELPVPSYLKESPLVSSSEDEELEIEPEPAAEPAHLPPSHAPSFPPNLAVDKKVFLAKLEKKLQRREKNRESARLSRARARENKRRTEEELNSARGTIADLQKQVAFYQMVLDHLALNLTQPVAITQAIEFCSRETAEREWNTQIADAIASTEAWVDATKSQQTQVKCRCQTNKRP